MASFQQRIGLNCWGTRIHPLMPDGNKTPYLLNDSYPFLAFSDLICHLEDMGIGIFWLHCAA